MRWPFCAPIDGLCIWWSRPSLLADKTILQGLYWTHFACHRKHSLNIHIRFMTSQYSITHLQCSGLWMCILFRNCATEVIRGLDNGNEGAGRWHIITLCWDPPRMCISWGDIDVFITELTTNMAACLSHYRAPCHQRGPSPVAVSVSSVPPPNPRLALNNNKQAAREFLINISAHNLGRNSIHVCCLQYFNILTVNVN